MFTFSWISAYICFIHVKCCYQLKPKNNSVANHLLFCNNLASYDDFSILTRENKTFSLELKESLIIMRDKTSMNKNIGNHCTYSTGPSNKIFVKILFAFSSCHVILVEWTFYYFATTVHVKGTVQFTFFFVMRLNITIPTSCDSLIVILVP